MELEKRKSFLINLMYWTAMLLIAYFVFKYMLGLMMPFLFALIFSSILRPISRFLVKKLHFAQKPASVLVTILFFATIGFLFALLGVKLVSGIVDLFGMFPDMYQTIIAPGLTELMNTFEEFANRFDISLFGALNEMAPAIIDSLGKAVSSISGTVGAWATSFVLRMPRLLVTLIVTVIATFFMAADYDSISELLMRSLPGRAREVALNIKNSFVRVLSRYGRSYAIIMVMTFVEITIGMLILGYKNALIIGIIVAVFDIFPVLGTGMILGPWAVIELIQGEYLRAFGLIALYLVVTVIRQIMEPKIVGSHVGLHPLATIIAIFIGGNLFGVVGFFGLPISIAIIHSLSEEGVINIFRSSSDDGADGGTPAENPEARGG